MITITRYFQNDKCTLGIMSVDGFSIPLYTAELPWKNNKANTSCIPTGKYTLKPYKSPTKGKCFSIEGVINRKYILIHSGNIPLEDSRGCLLVGKAVGYLKKELAVLDSRKALTELLDYIKEPTELVIKNLCV